MADVDTEAPGPAADRAADEGRDWGRVLDVAGILAGLVLVVIVVDIWTDGRLVSRHLQGGRRNDGEGPGDEHPGGD